MQGLEGRKARHTLARIADVLLYLINNGPWAPRVNIRAGSSAAPPAEVGRTRLVNHDSLRMRAAVERAMI